MLILILVKKQRFLQPQTLCNTTAVMIKFFLPCFLLCSVIAFAQKKNRHTPVIQKGVFLSFNPNALFEPEQGAVGIGIGYRFNKRIEVFGEASYLYPGVAADGGFDNLHGFRAIVGGKYFYQNKYGFFIGAECRVKQYSFDDNGTFINYQNNTTLNNYRYTPKHTLIGGGIFWGKRFKVTANGKFELEGNIGIGVKHRYIQRNNVPVGYIFDAYYYDRINPIPDHDDEVDLPYFPAAFRLIYHL